VIIMPQNPDPSARNVPAPALPTEAWGRLEGMLKRFEAAWRRGERPALDDYLAAADAERQALLVELAQEDLEHRLKAGEPARVEDYLDRYPELRADPDVVLDLIAAEHALRRRGEPDLDPEEYLRRLRLLAQRDRSLVLARIDLA
jgi:hypothetical protein